MGAEQEPADLRKTARLFVAVEPPEDFRYQLMLLKKEFPGAGWTARNNLHLTLRFIGERPLRCLPLIKRALRETRVGGFTLKMDRLGLFERSFQSILWAGLADSEGLSALKREVDYRLSLHLGLAPEQECFTPHITLSRVKIPIPGVWRNFIKTYHPARSAFAVSSFTLFRSLLKPGGAEHVPEEIYPLA